MVKVRSATSFRNLQQMTEQGKRYQNS